MTVISSFADSTSSNLLERARNRGDQEAWRKLITWIGPFVLRWCRAAKLQDADRRNVSQNVFANICRYYDTFRKEGPNHSFRAWVRKITKNCIHDLYREQAPRPVDGIESIAQPNSQEDLEIRVRAIYIILRDIAEKNSHDDSFLAFHRMVVDGLTSREVARELGIQADTARQYKCRWIKKLREQLREDFGDLLE